MNSLENSPNEQDIKPIFPSSPSSFTLSDSPQEISAYPKKWSPTNLQDGNRKSAFLPYKFYNSNSTVLTNLQRGNTIAENPIPQSIEVDFHMKAGQGELNELDIAKEQDINFKDETGLTPLHWACHYGQSNTVEMLLKHGADVNQLGPEEESALIFAASGGHHDIVKFLISQGANVNHEDHMCNTALMYAAQGNHPHTCQELLINGANFSLINLNDENAYTIAINNCSNLAQTVIEKFILSQLESAMASSSTTKRDLSVSSGSSKF